jgi:hypothetical protein
VVSDIANEPRKDLACHIFALFLWENGLIYLLAAGIYLSPISFIFSSA